MLEYHSVSSGVIRHSCGKYVTSFAFSNWIAIRFPARLNKKKFLELLTSLVWTRRKFMFKCLLGRRGKCMLHVSWNTFKKIYLLCYHFILLALNFNLVVRILSLQWLLVKICRFAQVIQSSKAISTFIRPTLWRRGNCHSTGSLTIKMSACTESNSPAVGSQVQV